MKKWFSAVLIVILAISLAACGQSNKNNSNANKDTATKNEQVFKIGAIPDQNASDLSKGMGAVAKYLSDKTGMKVEFVPSVDYAALVTAFQRGEINLAWFGGLTSVQARKLVPDAESFAQRPRDSQFQSVFITNSSTNINSLKDLKGKTFTFGSESSTSGYLMPSYYLLDAGINPLKDFNGKPNFSGSHDATYKLVESGAFNAGALNIAVWQAAVNDKKVDTNKVKVFYTTPPFFDYNWTINGNVDKTFGKGTKNKVENAILSITTDQKDITDFFQTDKFVKTNNGNYDKIEKVAKELQIIK